MTVGRLVSVITLGFAVLSVGCPKRPPEPETPAPPDSVTDPTDPAQRAAVLDYARGLKYEERDHGSFDRNLLDRGGTVGKVWPEENIHNTRRGTLETSARIQLRIVVESTPPLVSPPYGLPRDTSYVWVDSVVMVTRDSGYARAIIIPVNLADSVRRGDVYLHRMRRRFGAPVARWTPAKCWSCQDGFWCYGASYSALTPQRRR